MLLELNQKTPLSLESDIRTPSLRHRLVSSITRQYPFHSGCGNLSNSRLLQSIAGDGAGLVWSRLDCGLRILVPLDDFVGRAVYFIGDLDRKLTGFIKRIVRPGDHVLDIGANMGVVTLPLAKFVGENGVVHAFEPNPYLVDLLSRSLESNGLKNVHLHACALGEKEQENVLNYHRSNFGMGTLTTPQYNLGWTGVQVHVRTLDSLAGRYDLSRIRLVKVDVEDYEERVLQGGRSWLAATPPDVFLIEVNGAVDPEKNKALHLLTEFGYALYTIPKGLFSLRLTPYHSQRSAENGGCHDMVAIRPESEREITALFKV